MPRPLDSTPRGACLGGQIQRKLQSLALASLQQLDDCPTSQPGQRNPVPFGESRQLRVFAILQVDGHAIPGCHWNLRVRQEHTAAVCTTMLQDSRDLISRHHGIPSAGGSARRVHPSASPRAREGRPRGGVPETVERLRTASFPCRRRSRHGPRDHACPRGTLGSCGAVHGVPLGHLAAGPTSAGVTPAARSSTSHVYDSHLEVLDSDRSQPLKHDLRHSFALRPIPLGERLTMIGKLLGEAIRGWPEIHDQDS